MNEEYTRHDIETLIRRIAEFLESAIQWRQRIKYLKKVAEEPIEDHFIYAELLDNLSQMSQSSPNTRTLEFNGIKYDVTVTHRSNAESIAGVDLIYEINGKKAVLIQMKKESRRGRVTFDQDQMKKIENYCYFVCGNFIKPQIDDPKIHPFCSCYYSLVINAEKIYLPVCLVRSILTKPKRRKSASVNEFIRHGITKRSFIELFAKCFTGGRYPSPQLGRERVIEIMEFLLDINHMIFHVIES